jgi:antitoxin (DNA-binding transcriptional repressor) of toxin-antitoxin stability system
MKTINFHEAKTHLSRLVEKAARGEPFVIAKAGKPVTSDHVMAVVALPPIHKDPFDRILVGKRW